jgi:hypothetical protein
MEQELEVGIAGRVEAVGEGQAITAAAIGTKEALRTMISVPSRSVGADRASTA